MQTDEEHSTRTQTEKQPQANTKDAMHDYSGFHETAVEMKTWRWSLDRLVLD